jgi:hypothetical protein
MGKLNTVANGKGSKPRPVDAQKYASNFDDINWNSKKINKKQNEKHTNSTSTQEQQLSSNS